MECQFLEIHNDDIRDLLHLRAGAGSVRRPSASLVLRQAGITYINQVLSIFYDGVKMSFWPYDYKTPNKIRIDENQAALKPGAHLDCPAALLKGVRVQLLTPSARADSVLDMQSGRGSLPGVVLLPVREPAKLQSVRTW